MMVATDWALIFFEYFATEGHFINPCGEVWHFYQTLCTNQDMTIGHPFQIKGKVYAGIPTQIPSIVKANRHGTHCGSQENQIVPQIFFGGFHLRSQRHVCHQRLGLNFNSAFFAISQNDFYCVFIICIQTVNRQNMFFGCWEGVADITSCFFSQNSDSCFTSCWCLK